MADTYYRSCPEGGVCEFTPDIEYDPTGQTINCEKCGDPPPSEDRVPTAEDDRSSLRAIARALGLEVPPGEDAPTLVGRILNAAHQLRRDHDIMAKRCAEYERGR